MPTATVKYLGELRSEAIHLQSGNRIITDAPTDNHGKGEAFSPTDLLCTSLACCMVSLMGIVAMTHHITLGEIDADVTKTMAANPRRVSRIEIEMRFAGADYSEKEKQILERAAMTCPVFLSLHPDIEKDIRFIWA